MSRAGSAAHRDGGFTLLEALVVVALTALTATIVFPRVERSYAAIALHETTSTLTADIRVARAAAMRGGAPVVFAVADDGHSYGWSGSAMRAVSTSVALAPAGGTVTFYADGSASGGAFAVNAGPSRIPVAVDATTGAVVVGAQ